MKGKSEKVVCRTPTPGKKPTRIDAWKFEAVRNAILKALPRRGQGVLFSDLPDEVENQLADAELRDLGKVMWYTTVVKLEMEVRGEIRRVPKSVPQRLLKV